jgi:hypothetical protein
MRFTKCGPRSAPSRPPHGDLDADTMGDVTGFWHQPRRELDRSCPHRPPANEIVISVRPVSVFAKGPDCEIEQLRGYLRSQRRETARAVMVLLSLHGLPATQIAALLNCHPATVRHWISRFNEGTAGLTDVFAEDETHLNLPPHVRASWTLRGTRPQIPTPGKNR